MIKKVLFILRHSPYGTSLAREAAEAVLASGSFEQSVSVLFMDDGVLQLIDQQSPLQGTKNHAAMLKALPMYEVEDLYVDQTSLEQRNLKSEQVIAGIKPINVSAIQKLMADHDHIVSF